MLLQKSSDLILGYTNISIVFKMEAISCCARRWCCLSGSLESNLRNLGKIQINWRKSGREY